MRSTTSSSLAAPAAAVGMPMRQSFVHGADDLLIHQHPIGVFHPIFAKIAQFRGDQPIAETELCPPHLNHIVPPWGISADRCRLNRAKIGADFFGALRKCRHDDPDKHRVTAAFQKPAQLQGQRQAVDKPKPIGTAMAGKPTALQVLGSQETACRAAASS